MSIQQMDNHELRNVIMQLDQALYNHQQWFSALIRSLICRLPPDKHNIADDAHRECLFGQWYYGPSISKKLNDHQGFIAIGDAHKRMHELAASLLKSAQTKNVIAAPDYDNFANILERMRLEILTLKNELENLLYNHDPLTMAINRLSMLPILREHQELLKRNGQTSCVVMMDLDEFKALNDKYGHAVGDKVLACASHHIINSLRPYDKVFRYGGEEFLILLQQSTIELAVELFEKIRASLTTMPITFGDTNQSIHISASFGIANLDPNLPVEQSIDRADKALYTAKTEGRNLIKTWEPV